MEEEFVDGVGICEIIPLKTSPSIDALWANHATLLLLELCIL